jgi:hypothetical protein
MMVRSPSDVTHTHSPSSHRIRLISRLCFHDENIKIDLTSNFQTVGPISDAEQGSILSQKFKLFDIHCVTNDQLLLPNPH